VKLALQADLPRIFASGRAHFDAHPSPPPPRPNGPASEIVHVPAGTPADRSVVNEVVPLDQEHG